MSSLNITLPCTKQQVDQWVLQCGGQESFVKQLSAHIESTNKPLPLPILTDEECKRDFLNLCNLNCNQLWSNGKWSSKFEYMFNNHIKDNFVESKTVGSVASRKFTITECVKTDHQAIPGLQRAWNTPKSRQSVLRALFSNVEC